MFRKAFFFTLLIVLVGASACAALPTNTQPTAVSQANGQPTQMVIAPTATLPAETPAPSGPDWAQIANPGMPLLLPQTLDQRIHYVNPPENCAKLNDPQETCSTREGQPTHGDFTLKAGYARVLTGDEISVSRNGQAVSALPDPALNHTVWLLVNISNSDLVLTMDAPDGSFRGNLSASWTPELIAQLRDLTLWQFVVGPNPIPTPAPAGPTPVVNCGDTNACDRTNVVVGIWNGETWTFVNGIYVDNFYGFNWTASK